MLSILFVFQILFTISRNGFFCFRLSHPCILCMGVDSVMPLEMALLEFTIEVQDTGESR